MKKEYYLYLAVLAVVIAGLVFAIYNKNKAPATTVVNTLNKEMTLYYGDGCPHCANVDKFVADNKIAEKIKFTKKEVFNNSANADEMVAVAKQCGLDEKKVGVPFLWTGTECLTGDTPIIDYFKQLAGLK